MMTMLLVVGGFGPDNGTIFSMIIVSKECSNKIWCWHGRFGDYCRLQYSILSDYLKQMACLRKPLNFDVKDVSAAA